jgi:hypothetical protein
LYVSLYVKMTSAPTFGSAVTDPMTPPRVQVLERYEFASMKEVRP